MGNPSVETAFGSFIDGVSRGDIATLRQGLEKWPTFATQREAKGEGWGAIHHVAALGHIASATLLLDVGCSADLPSGEFIKDGEDDLDGYFEPGVRPIAVATWKDQLAMVKLLLARGADPTGSNHFSHSAVHVAATHNRINILNVLIANGADVNGSSDWRYYDEELGWHFALSPLHAAARSNATEAARCLLAHGARLDACSFDLRTPLFYAVAHGSTAVARVLLKAGSDPNAREVRVGYGSQLDYTPLHYAATNGHAETVKLLLEFGADASALESNRKRTARELANAAGFENVVAVLDACSFPEGITKLDLAEVGTLTITDDANTLLEESDEEGDDVEVLEDEDTEKDDDDSETANDALCELHPVDEAERILAESVRMDEVLSREAQHAHGVEDCGFCGCDLSTRGFYVDGSLRGQGMWANMCIPCFKLHGEGIGWGRGQLFAHQLDGAWRLVAGFSPRG